MSRVVDDAIHGAVTHDVSYEMNRALRRGPRRALLKTTRPSWSDDIYDALYSRTNTAVFAAVGFDVRAAVADAMEAP